MLKKLSREELKQQHVRSSAPPSACRDGLAKIYNDALEITRRIAPDAPIFCFSKAALSAKLAEFRHGFPGTVTYAVKANPSPEIIDALAGLGMSAFDVASPVEMELVRAVHPRATLHYHNPIKSRSEIARAYTDFGVRHFAVDDTAEIDKIAQTVGTCADVELVVRFRAAKNRAVCDFSTKFGADVAHAADLLRLAHRLGFRTALTFHPGSQCLDPLSYVENIEGAAGIAREAGIELQQLNVGGGFPVTYPGQPVPPLSAFFEAIETATRSAFGSNRPELTAEPGRALVAGCTSLLARVKHRRPDTGDLFLNDGIYGALLEQTQFQVDLPCRALRGGEVLTGTSREFVVYGPTCDPIDRIPRMVSLPSDISEGDWVEFGLVGAYGAATTTRFNGYGAFQSVAVANVLQAK